MPGFDASVAAPQERLEPIFGRVVVRPIEPDPITSSGLVLPASSEGVRMGQVLAVSAPPKESAPLPDPASPFAVGDRVFYLPGDGVPVTVGGQSLLVMEEYEILGILRVGEP